MKKFLSIFFLASLMSGAAFADHHEMHGDADAGLNVGTEISVDDGVEVGADADADVDTDVDADAGHGHMNHDGHAHGEMDADVDADADAMVD